MQDIELETEKVAAKETVSIESVEVDDRRANGRYIFIHHACLYPQERLVLTTLPFGGLDVTSDVKVLQLLLTI